MSPHLTGAPNRGGVTAVTRSPTTRGYVMVIVGFLLVAMTGALVRLATATESVLIVIRMGSAALIVTLLLVRAGTFRQLTGRRTLPLVLLFGSLSAGSMLLYFLAIRGTDVAIATFLLFTSPVYVAVLAPRTLGEITSRVAYLALGIALLGMVAIVVPGCLDATVPLIAAGLVEGLAAGALLGAYTLVLKRLTRSVGSIALTWAEVSLVAVLLLPLATVQLAVGAALPSGRDWVIALVLGVIVTSLAYLLLIEGASRVRVQHWAILSYLMPVAAPVYAFFILGEIPGLWTIAGGALIVAAGFLVAVRDTRSALVEPGTPEDEEAVAGARRA